METDIVTIPRLKEQIETGQDYETMKNVKKRGNKKDGLP